MNTIIMKCGHLGPAIGAPGSSAREACEQSECINCIRDKAIKKLIATHLNRLVETPKKLPTSESEY